MKYTSFFITRQEEKYGMLDENPIYFYGNGAFLYVLKTPGTTLAILTLPRLLYHYILEYPALIDSASTGMPVENFPVSCLINSFGVR